ncbi:hypothetical protein [Rubinisphaera margarita]|uniref:hypothetical protein n=1 Tax=Rubinisphaera margarita TaxID=2909586 RepID=UPI001EE8DCCC|nr:hypothetical protein [Rubinisphaera margarita]MCG6156734.1 hypothetical protein [Rubinisphaera margarita]
MTAVLTSPEPELQKPPSEALPGRKRPLRTEWRVLGVVILCFLMLEFGFRIRGDVLSKDISHLQSFDRLSRELAAGPEDELRVLFLGNSLTRYGVDQKLFVELTGENTEKPLRAVKVNPDNTALADWYYAYQSYFDKPERVPDVVVIGFEGGHLRDAPSHHPDRLAYYYCRGRQPAELGQFDLKTFEERAYFTLCSMSAAFANRDRIQRRVLDMVIPSYRSGMDELNLRMAADAGKVVEQEPSYERLLKFVAMAERNQVQVILAAMPVPEYYEFDQAMLDVVHSTSAELVDCREVPGLKVTMFFDGLHMDEDAARLYTTALVGKSEPYLCQLPVKPGAKFPGIATLP